MAYYNVPDLTIDALTLYIHVFSLRKDTTAIFLVGLFVKHFQLLGRSLLLSTKLFNASLDRAEHRKTFDFQITYLIKDYKSVFHLSPFWPNLLRSKASAIPMSKSPTIMRKRVDQPLCNTTSYPKWRRCFVWLYDDIRCAVATDISHRPQSVDPKDAASANTLPLRNDISTMELSPVNSKPRPFRDCNTLKETAS
jgi:hypothetical protein